MKYTLLAGAMMIAAPAFAQEAPAPAQATPQGATSSTPAPMGQAAPVDNSTGTATQDGTVSAGDETAQAQPAPAQPGQPSAANDVAGVVNREFKTYDKDGDGALNKVEFAAWMDALKSASGDTGAAADPKWNDKAFAQADKDKSTTVNQTELTSFLSGAAQAS